MNSCPQCGQKLVTPTKFCPNCGRNLAEAVAQRTVAKKTVNKSASRSPNTAVDTEPTYYSDEEGVRVTATRLIIPGKTFKEGFATYYIGNIASIKSEKDVSIKVFGAITVLIGIVLIIVRAYVQGANLIAGGIALILLGLVIVILLSPTYHLIISGDSGEVDALKMNKKQKFDHIMTAINEVLNKQG